MNTLFKATILVLLLSGCGENKIDSSTNETLKSSIEEVKSPLSDEKKKEFEEAIQLLVFSGVTNIFELASADTNALQRKFRDSINGKTADEIIQEAQKVKEERIIKEVEEIRAKIAELKEKRSKAKKAQKHLEKFEVTRSLFYFQKNYYRSEPVIELRVKNQTEHAISRVYFHGILKSPDRSVPWVEDDFNYQISGGIEPGEEVTWTLSLNRFGDWGKAPKKQVA